MSTIPNRLGSEEEGDWIKLVFCQSQFWACSQIWSPKKSQVLSIMQWYVYPIGKINSLMRGCRTWTFACHAAQWNTQLLLLRSVWTVRLIHDLNPFQPHPFWMSCLWSTGVSNPWCVSITINPLCPIDANLSRHCLRNFNSSYSDSLLKALM